MSPFYSTLQQFVCNYNTQICAWFGLLMTRLLARAANEQASARHECRAAIVLGASSSPSGNARRDDARVVQLRHAVQVPRRAHQRLARAHDLAQAARAPAQRRALRHTGAAWFASLVHVRRT